MDQSSEGGRVLKSLILTEQRVRIAALLMADGGTGKFSSPEIAAATGLGKSTVQTNMRSLAASGWFELGWEEDLDPYDFGHDVVRRQIFVRGVARQALSLCLEDFRNSTDPGSARQIEYAPPRVEDGVARCDYLAVKEDGHLPVGMREILLHCLKDSDRYYHSSDLVPGVCWTKNTALWRMGKCEEAGLMVSKFAPGEKSTPRRVFTLTAKGVVVASSLAGTDS